MESQKKKLLAFIQGFFRFSHGLFLVLACLFLLMGLLMPFFPEIQKDFCGIWINFTLANEGTTFQIGGTLHPATLTRTTGWLLIEDGPLYLSYLNLLFILVLLSVGIYSLKKTILIVERVRRGEVFHADNMLDIKRIALVNISLFLILLLTQIFVGFFNRGRISSEVLVYTGLFGSSMDWDIFSLVYPLFLWVIAEVFRRGLELKSEQDLTI